jgi:hypothetical protein
VFDGFKLFVVPSNIFVFINNLSTLWLYDVVFEFIE